MAGWIIAAIVGGVAGWLASMVMNRNASMGILWNILAGVVGAGVGNFIGQHFGFVGNIKFQNAKSAGKFSMTGNWQVNFSDIEGKPRSYPVYFTCIKGARVLWIDGTGFGKAE